MNGIALQPKASNRAIARVVGVNRSTIDRDQRGSNEPPTIDKPSPANGASGSNAPPSLTGEPAAGRLSPALREKLAFVIEHDPRSVRADGGIGLDAAREAAAGGLLAGEVIARLTQFLTGSSSEAAAE